MNWILVRSMTLLAMLAIATPMNSIADGATPLTSLLIKPAAPVKTTNILRDRDLNSLMDFNMPGGTGITDGSFENGPAPASAWTEAASDPGQLPRIIDALDVTLEPAQDGTYCWWGGTLSGGGFTNAAFQTITIPDAARSIKFHHSIYRPDADDADADYLRFYINGVTVYNKPLRAIYHNFPTFTMDYLDVADYQGQDIVLEIYSTSPGTDGANVLVDNLTTDETLAQQPIHDAYTAVISQDRELANDHMDAYVADDFELETKRRITKFWAPGGIIGALDLATATAVNVAIYADAGGVPEGYPNDGTTTPIWSLSAPTTDAQVVINADLFGTTGDITVTPDTPPTLEAGVYWIVSWVEMNTGVSWYWGVSNADHGANAVFINPGDGFGTGATTWTSLMTTHGYTGLAGAIEHEAVGSSGGGGGGGGGGCFISAMK